MRIGPEPMTSAFFPGSGDGFVLLLVGAVEVRRRGVELGGAGVDHLVDGPDAPLYADEPHLLGEAVGEDADLLVGEAHPLGLPQQVGREGLGQEALLHGDDVRHLVEEPGVDARLTRQLHRRQRRGAAPP